MLRASVEDEHNLILQVKHNLFSNEFDIISYEKEKKGNENQTQIFFFLFIDLNQRGIQDLPWGVQSLFYLFNFQWAYRSFS